ncbi:MAG: TRAP transporter substrate-binding protein [Syntrophomonas sp.]
MNRKKKYTVLIALVISLSLLLTGCGSTGSQKAKEQSEQPQKSDKQYTLRIGHNETTTSVTNKGLERFKKQVEEGTNGKVTVELYPASQLGNARVIIESVQAGTLEGAAVPNSNYTGFYAPATIADLPYFFPTKEIAYKVMDGEVGQQFLKGYEKTNIKPIALWETGFKMFTCNSPIKTPADFKGKKFRVMENPILIAQYKALGADAIPINFAELYNSLQQGVVDGQETPPAGIFNMKLYEVQKYLLKSEHGWLPVIIGVNTKWFDSLPKEYQDVVAKSATDNRDWVRQELRRLEKEVYMPTFEKAGVKIVDLTPEEKQVFANQVKDDTEAALLKMLDSDGKAIYEKLKAKVAEEASK